MHIHSAPQWTFGQQWVLISTSWQYSLGRMARHSLSCIESLRTYSAIKGQSKACYLALHFSCTVTLNTSPILNGSNLGQFTLQYGKSLDSFMRTNIACHCISKILPTFWDEGWVKERRKGKEGKSLKDLIDHTQESSTAPFFWWWSSHPVSANWISIAGREKAERTYSACRSLLPLSPDMWGRLEKCSAYDSRWLR